MKVYYCEQGSDEWNDLHLGRPTASSFHRVVQPGGEPRVKKNGDPYASKAGELAEGRWTFAYELVVERLLGETKRDAAGLHYPERGKLLEEDAIRHYQFLNPSVQATKVGFITPDHGLWGCSPDRLITPLGETLTGDDLRSAIGGLEIKSPSAEKHIEYFWRGPRRDYWCQLQGSMMITGFEWWEFQSFHPQLPDAYRRFERDDDFIDKLHKGLSQFCEEVDAVEQSLREAGFIDAMATPASRDDWQRMLEADPGLWTIA
jgi:hypothetical protein